MTVSFCNAQYTYNVFGSLDSRLSFKRVATTDFGSRLARQSGVRDLRMSCLNRFDQITDPSGRLAPFVY